MNTRISVVVLLAVAGGCTYGREPRSGNGGGGLAVLDAGCDPNAGVDACASAGLACTPLLPSNAFTCQLPGAFFACDPSVGCATGLQCADGECLQSCTATADCTDPLTACGPLQDGGATFCLLDSCGLADGGGFWEPCDDAGGTCVFLFGSRRVGPQGACLQGGAVAAGGDCGYYRGSDAGLCAPGLICTVDAAGDNAGVCMPVCDPFFDGGPSCSDGTACVESAIPAAPPTSYFDYYNHSGVCAQTCTPMGDAGVADAGGPADAGDVDAGPDAGDPDAGTVDAGPPDGGDVDAGMADAGDDAGADAGLDGGDDAGLDAGPPDAGSPTPDAGPGDAGETASAAACSAPTACVNASPDNTPTFVCLP